MTEDELLAAMRGDLENEDLRLVYADWLLSHGDIRGELVILDHRERTGAMSSLAEINRLLELSAEHGFPRLPDDPCARILRFTGGGSFPTQYFVHHEGHEYYLRYRYGFSIDVDDVTVLECDLDTLTGNEWTFRETNVILAIVSDAILRGAPLSKLEFPNQAGIQAHPSYVVGRSPLYGLPHGMPPEQTLELRDWARWNALWERRQRLLGIEPPKPVRVFGCACGVPGMSCGVRGCDQSGR